MMYAVCITAHRVRDNVNVDIQTVPFLMEAFNRDEAIGFGIRLSKHLPKGWAATVQASSTELDPSKPVESIKKINVQF